MRIVFAALGALALSLVGACGTEVGSTPGECEQPQRNASLDSLEIGAGSEYGFKTALDSAAFQPWADGDAAARVTGDQGSSMVVVRLRVRGSAAPACLEQQTTLVSAGEIVGKNILPVKTEETTGARVTGDIRLILTGGLGSEAEVTVTAGGLTMTRHLRMVEVGALRDAGVDR